MLSCLKSFTTCRPVIACRDLRDNHILEVAIGGKADIVVTGDLDLLSVNPFQGIPILTTKEFLEQFGRVPDPTE